MNAPAAENRAGGPKTARPLPRADRLTTAQAADLRKLRDYLRGRAAMRQAARRADGLALILEAVHKRGEAVAAEHIADVLRQALR